MTFLLLLVGLYLVAAWRSAIAFMRLDATYKEEHPPSKYEWVPSDATEGWLFTLGGLMWPLVWLLFGVAFLGEKLYAVLSRESK